MAARIREEMERKGWTNVQLARKADLSDKTVSRLINGRKEPRYGTVERVAKALGVAEEDLRGTPPPPLALGADEETQLDRIERQISEIHAMLTLLLADQSVEVANRSIQQAREQLLSGSMKAA